MNEDISEYKDYAIQVAQEEGVDPRLFYGLLTTECSWINQVSYDGAHFGAGQLSQELADEYGIDPWNPTDNIRVSAKYLKKNLDYYNGDYDAAIQAYNTGMGAYDSGDRNYDYLNKVKMYSLEAPTGSGQSDASLSYPSDELDLSHPMQIQEGIYDKGLAHTDKALVQQANSLNAWCFNTFGKEMVVSGGWRDEAYNASVNGAANSRHLSGRALDIDVSTFSPEEREQIEAKAQSMGFGVLYHDAGTGEHLHLSEPDEGFTYIPQAGDNLPDMVDGGIFGIGAQSSLMPMTKEQLLGALDLDTSDFWKSYETPSAVQALWHGFTGGGNWVYNFLYALNADLFHSDNSIDHWEASKDEIDNAAQILYGSREEAERMAKLSRDDTQFAYNIEQRRQWLEEQQKYSDYYESIGLHTVGALGAAVLDPLNFVGGLGLASKAAKAGAALKIAKNTGEAVKSAEQIDKVASLAAKVAEMKIATNAINRTRNFVGEMLTPHTGAVGVAQSTMKHVASGAVQNIAQDYLVSKATYRDTHMADAALMGGVASGALHLIGRTVGKGLNVFTPYGKATQDMRSAAERVENGTLREAVGLKNQYKVQQAQIISDIADKEDKAFFTRFSKGVQDIVANNRVIALSRADAEKVASDSGFTLDPKAKAWYDSATDATFVVKDAVQDMSDTEVTNLLRHEIGVHQNLKATMGDEAYDRLMKQINNGRQNPTSVWAQAAKHVDSTDPEEILGYAIENGMLNAKDGRFLFKGIRKFLDDTDLSDKEILDFVSQSMTNAKLKDRGIAFHENPDGSVVLNGIKFSKDNMANPNRLLDILEMAKAGTVGKRNAKEALLDMMDGKGPFGKLTMTNFGDVYHNPIKWINKFASSLWEDEQRRGLQHTGIYTIPSVERMSSFFESQLTPFIYKIGDLRNNWLRDTYGRLSVYNPLHADSRRIPFNEAVFARFNKDYRGIEPTHVADDLLNNKYVIEAAKEIKAYRDKMLELGKKSSDMFGMKDIGENMVDKDWIPIDNELFRVVDEDKMEKLWTRLSNRGTEGLRKFFYDYAVRYADRDLLAKQLQREEKMRRTREIPLAQEAVEKAKQALLDGHERYSNYLKNDNGVIDNYITKLRKWSEEEEQLRAALGGLTADTSESSVKQAEKMRQRLEKIANMKKSNTEKLYKKVAKAKANVERGEAVQGNRLFDLQQKLKEYMELKEEPTELTKVELENIVKDRAEDWANRLLRDNTASRFDDVRDGRVGELSYFKKRLPMNTSGEMQLPDGSVFSFDKDLRNTDVDYIMQRNARRFAGESAMKNFLDNNALSLDDWKKEVKKEIDIATGRTISKAQARNIEESFDDMIKNLRGMYSGKDNYSTKDAVMKIFKNLAYSKNGAMMGINQLGDLSSGIATSGLGMVSSITGTTMRKMLSSKFGKENMDEIMNLSMLLEGQQVAGKVFSVGFRDRVTKEALSSTLSGSSKWLSKAADFTGNMTKITSKISQLGQLTDNQVRYAQAQAIADAAQWAWGRKFSAWRNPFSKSKLKELGVSEEKVKHLKASIQIYLGWNGKKDTSFIGDKIPLWQKESPETFWLFRELIHNQVSRAVLLNSKGNANKLMQNNMLASSLLMFKGFSFRASNARFARALRTKDLDDALAFVYSLGIESSIYAARQIAKIGTLYALGQTEQAQYIRDNYLNSKALARAAMVRPAFMSPLSIGNDMYEAATGEPTIRTTISNTNRTQAPQSAGDVAGNIISQSPVVSTVDEMTFRPVKAAMKLLEGTGTKSDVTKLLHGIIPIPNIIGLTQAVDTLAKTTLGSNLPEQKRKSTRQKKVQKSTEPSVLDKLFGK